MKLETLRSLWHIDHPGGNIWYTDAAGNLSDVSLKGKKYAVNFVEDGKLYTYTSSSVYALAERLDLIPESKHDYNSEAHEAISAILVGGTYKSTAALTDTIKHICRTDGIDLWVKSVDAGLDEYDRSVFEFVACARPSWA